MTDMRRVEELRLRLLANGFCPLPNVDKRCMFKGWPTVVVDEAEIRSWTRKRRMSATGLRIEKLLCVIDIDINLTPEISDEIRDTIDSIVPGLSSKALIRWGKGMKEAWFVRTDEMFSRIHSRRWLAPGSSADDGTHAVEVFGGASPRQFGAFGAHTRLDNGEVLVSYEWNGPSPVEVALTELPVVTKAELFKITDAVGALLERRGCTPILRSSKGENAVCRAYDLTDAMQFDMADGRRLSLSELSDAAQHDTGLRCSASWLEGPTAVNTSRCIVGTTRQKALTIWESASGVTHMVRPIAIDMNEVVEKLRRAREIFHV